MCCNSIVHEITLVNVNQKIAGLICSVVVTEATTRAVRCGWRWCRPAHRWSSSALMAPSQPASQYRGKIRRYTSSYVFFIRCYISITYETKCVTNTYNVSSCLPFLSALQTILFVLLTFLCLIFSGMLMEALNGTCANE